MEIFFQVKFQNFQFVVQLRATTLKSQTPSQATISVLFKAWLETAWLLFYSLFPFTLYKGRFCTSCASLSLSPSERPSACLMPLSAEEKIPEAVWGQCGCRAPQGSRTWMWTVPAGVRRQKELLLVLTDKSGHKGIQRKRPGIVRRGGQREDGGLLAKNCIFCGMEDTKNWIWELLIPSLVKGKKV